MNELVNQQSNMPTNKMATVAGTGIFGAPIVDWIANDILDLGMPGVVAAQIAIIIGGIVAWFVRNRAV